jgi:hypothetical protein
MNVRNIAIVFIAMATIIIGAPAYAGNRIASSSIITIQPGADSVFENGDPIRICVSPVTERVTQYKAKMSIDVRPAGKQGAWSSMGTFRQGTNNTYCLMGQVHGHRDIQVRARTITTPYIKGSISRVITIDMEA